jgi:hypothetical protein
MESDKSDTIKKKLLQALEDHHGIISTSCKAVGIARSTFYEWIDKDEDFKKAVDEIKDVAIDFVESKLFQQIDEGNPTSTIFYLKTKAKQRGYVERQEIVHDGKLENTVVEWRVHKDEDGDNG